MILFKPRLKKGSLQNRNGDEAESLITLWSAKKSRTPICTRRRSSFRIFRAGEIATRSQLWFPSSLSSTERLVLLTLRRRERRRRATQEKRDSRGIVGTLRGNRGLKLFRAGSSCFVSDDEDDRHVNDAFPVYAPTDADTRRAGKSHERRTR